MNDATDKLVKIKANEMHKVEECNHLGVRIEEGKNSRIKHAQALQMKGKRNAATKESVREPPQIHICGGSLALFF